MVRARVPIVRYTAVGSYLCILEYNFFHSNRQPEATNKKVQPQQCCHNIHTRRTHTYRLGAMRNITDHSWSMLLCGRNHQANPQLTRWPTLAETNNKHDEIATTIYLQALLSFKPHRRRVMVMGVVKMSGSFK